MKIKELVEDRVSKKPARKGSLAWEIQQQRKEYDKKNPPVEPKDNMVGAAKILKKESALDEARKLHKELNLESIRVSELIEGKYGSIRVAPPGQQRGHEAGLRRGGNYAGEEKKRLSDEQVTNLKKDVKDFGWKKGQHLKHLHKDDQEKVFESFGPNEFKGKKDKLVSTSHKVGDEVICDEGGGSSKYGKVHRLGRTMVHVKHNDGSVAAYDPKHVDAYTKTYFSDKQGKQK